MNADKRRSRIFYLLYLRSSAFICVPILLLAGCGSVGDPLPPSLQIPLRVTDLAVLQRGATLLVEFTAPAETTDGVPLRRLGAIELLVGDDRVDVSAEAPGPVRVETPAARWANREVTIRVRVAGRKHRFSEWSNEVRMRIVEPLAAPQGVRAEAAPQGVKLSWTGPQGVQFRVYRRAGKEPEPALAATVDQPAFVDAGAQYGTPYEYSVQSYLKTGDAAAVSDPSPPVAIVPVDTFPPGVPSGLTATAGAGAVQLTWTADTERDLAGYFVYRAAPGGAFERLGGRLPTPFYADRTAAAGTTYRYAVSAIDQNENESARSAPVEITAQ